MELLSYSEILSDDLLIKSQNKSISKKYWKAKITLTGTAKSMSNLSQKKNISFSRRMKEKNV